MTLLYITRDENYDNEIIALLEERGIRVKQSPSSLLTEFFSPDQNNRQEEASKAEINKVKMKKAEIESFLERDTDSSVDIVFTLNFIREISDWCESRQLPYACWVIRLPNYDLYTSSVYNSCNYIGLCDSYLVEKLLKEGVRKVFLLPVAAAGEIEMPKPYKEREFCYIADRTVKTMNYREVSLYSKGYLEAFLHVQRVLPGESILENGLLNRVYRELLVNNGIPESILPAMEKLFFADYYLNPECMHLTENIFLQNNGNLMTIYSQGDFPMCNAVVRPSVKDKGIRKQIYADKEFSLVLTPYTIHRGMDQRVLQVIAAGGFPVCSYRKDYDIFFEKDKNLAYFKSREEFAEILTRYGNDRKERDRLMEEAYDHVRQNHTFKNRIDTMLHFWEKLS